MRAVTVETPGGPEVLRAIEVADPVPGPGEILIEVAAAGVNRADLLQRAGHYPPPPGAPPWPGLEVSGTVVGVGPDAEGPEAEGPDADGPRWAVGDRVAALLDGGGYAQRVAVPAAQVLAVPDGVGLVEAAALPEAVCTVWSMLWSGLSRVFLQPGEWLLVHGGSGGVGSIAVQLAAARGARVLATAGGPERAGRCLTLGAEAVIDHRTEDFVARVAELTSGHGADVVLDVIGAAYLERNVEALATGGRLVVIGLQKGRRGELDLRALLSKRATVVGATLRARPLAEKARVVAEVREHVWPMVADGRVRPVVHERIPLSDAARAHELMASGGPFGKLLLVP